MSALVHACAYLPGSGKLLPSEMSASGPKKYYDVHRPLTERDTLAHLQGWNTTGACLRHADGMTRALCYDADTPADWQHLVEAV